MPRQCNQGGLGSRTGKGAGATRFPKLASVCRIAVDLLQLSLLLPFVVLLLLLLLSLLLLLCVLSLLLLLFSRLGHENKVANKHVNFSAWPADSRTMTGAFSRFYERRFLCLPLSENKPETCTWLHFIIRPTTLHCSIPALFLTLSFSLPPSSLCGYRCACWACVSNNKLS